MKQINVDNSTYNAIKKIADRIDMEIEDVLYNAIGDGVLEEFYKNELREADERDE